MNRQPQWVSGLAASLLLAASLASAAPPSEYAAPIKRALETAPQQHMQLAFSLSCRAQGSPVEFPNDVALINNGPGSVPSGTQVHWRMNTPSYQGNYTFSASLARGKMVIVPEVLGSGVQAGQPCTVEVVK